MLDTALDEKKFRLTWPLSIRPRDTNTEYSKRFLYILSFDPKGFCIFRPSVCDTITTIRPSSVERWPIVSESSAIRRQCSYARHSTSANPSIKKGCISFSSSSLASIDIAALRASREIESIVQTIKSKAKRSAKCLLEDDRQGHLDGCCSSY